MIRIITNTTFGYWNGKFVEPKTKDSAPFSIDPKREAELVAQGIAEYVGTDEEAPAADTAGADNENDGGEVIQDGFEVTLEYLEGLTLEHLKEFADQFGIKYKIGTKKADFAKMVYDSLDPETNDELTTVPPEGTEDADSEDDGEEPPTVDPADAVV